MAYKIIICEKPSVAKEYAKALEIKSTSQKDGYIEGRSAYDGKDYRITWSIGHLVTLSYPEKYDESLKNWSIESLPFLPDTYKYEVIAAVRKQYAVVKKLYHSNDVDTIYYAGDSGREGIYIQMLIRMLAGHAQGITEKVVWIDSQTKTEILRGIAQAKPISVYQNLIDASYMRAIEDYAIGINFSRALSCKYGAKFNSEIASTKYKPISVGRVMTCVLGMIVRREREIKDFKETIFYKPSALCGNFVAKWKAIEGTTYHNSPDVYNNEGFLSYQNAMAFTNGLKQNPVLEVEKAELKTEKKYAPMLYNLAEIQNDCTKLFKISPDETLAVIQTLYEQKMVTYPRTDARVVSSAVAKEIDVNLRNLKNHINYKKEFVEEILGNGTYKNLANSKYCDDSKITDHYAIIPTGEGNIEDLKGIHADVYKLIVRRFLSVFYPPAEYKKAEIILRHKENEYFFVSEKVLKQPGYLVVLEEGNAELDTALMSMKKGDRVNAQYQVTEGKTTPPKRYTSGSMILAMENAGNLIEDEELRNQIKSSGIGTSATRAGIITKLVLNGYIMLEKKTQILKPLKAGELIFDIVSDTIPLLLSPKMTASWEKGLSQIEEGKINRVTYTVKLNKYITDEINKIKDVHVEEPEKTAPITIGACPYCGGEIVTVANGYRCSNYSKDGGCSFYVTQIAERMIAKTELAELLNKGRTKTLSGFKSKSGKKFSAMLVLNKEEKKISFEFEDNEPTDTAFECPKCSSKLVKDTWNLTCGCGFKLSHTISKKKLTDKQLRGLLAGRTELIAGFTGKTGKKFDAYLTFDGERVGFEFPERK